MVAEIAQVYAERSGAGTAGQSSASQLEIADGTVPVDNEGNASEPVIELSHVSYSYSLSPRERRRWHKRSARRGQIEQTGSLGKRPQQSVGTARCIADGASRRVPGLGRSYWFG